VVPTIGRRRSLFRNETGGRSSVVTPGRGAVLRHGTGGRRSPRDGSIGGAELAPGDYLYTTPGEEHDVVAISDAVIFVSSQKATAVVE
jgi:hypothetical protein